MSFRIMLSAAAMSCGLVFALPALAQNQTLLIDVHKNANVSCQACHGEGPFTEPVSMQTCVDCHGDYEALAARATEVGKAHPVLPADTDCATCHTIHK